MSHLGVVVLHGLGGSPHAVMPITAAVHGAGYATVSPHLPGHGTTPDDLIGRTWTEWLNAVLEISDELAARTERVVLIGQSLGATLALAAAPRRDSIIGVAAINALVLPPDPDATEHLHHLIGRGRTMQPAGDPDLRDPEAHDSSYPELALTALIELGVGAAAVNESMHRIVKPTFIASSSFDSVVAPENSDVLAAAVRGPVRRLVLPHSAHVAALDLDRDRLCNELLTWLADLTDGSVPAG